MPVGRFAFAESDTTSPFSNLAKDAQHGHITTQFNGICVGA